MPLRDNKNPSSPSVFQPTALLREARRQKRLATVDVPALWKALGVALAPDGSVVTDDAAPLAAVRRAIIDGGPTRRMNATAIEPP